MKKIITILSVLMCMTVACSDDEDTKDYPELPDRDLDISVPVVPADWEPGMAYKPYEDDMPEPLNVDVHVLVVGEGEQLENVLHVLNNALSCLVRRWRKKRMCGSVSFPIMKIFVSIR